jgi:hypothetical protein
LLARIIIDQFCSPGVFSAKVKESSGPSGHSLAYAISLRFPVTAWWGRLTHGFESVAVRSIASG